MAETEKKQHQGETVTGQAELEGGAACLERAELGLPYVDEKAPPTLQISVEPR